MVEYYKQLYFEQWELSRKTQKMYKEHQKIVKEQQNLLQSYEEQLVFFLNLKVIYKKKSMKVEKRYNN